MKKRTSILAIILLVSIFLNPCLADSSLDSVVNIVFGYNVWAVLYGVPDFDDEITTLGENDEGENSMRVDCLSVTYDNHTIETKYALFAYSYDGINTLHQTYQDMRALALFSSVEIGIPEEFSEKEFSEEKINSAKVTSMKIKDKLDAAMQQYKTDIESGEFIPFYISSKGTYYIFSMQDGDINRYMIYIK